MPGANHYITTTAVINAVNSCRIAVARLNSLTEEPLGILMSSKSACNH
jgi:hypothetical protein